MNEAETLPSKFSVYVAAPRAAAPRAQRLAKEMTADGFVVTSQWHSAGEPIVDPNHRSVRSDILWNNTKDLHAADVVFALMDEGHPRATYCEIGWALAQDKMVIWVTDGADSTRACIYDSHPRVCVVKSDEAGLALLRELWSASPRPDLWQKTEQIREHSNFLRLEVARRMERTLKAVESPVRDATMQAVAAHTGDAAVRIAAEPHDRLSPIAWIDAAVDVIAGSIILVRDSQENDADDGMVN